MVTAPFILDFGKVTIDKAPEYDPETMAAEDREHAERFGPQYWPRVQDLLLILKYRYGIHYLDPKPGNIMFKDWDA